MAAPLPGLLLLDGGLSSLGALREFCLLIGPLALTGLVAVALCVLALVRRRASRSFVRAAVAVAALNGVASAAYVARVAGDLGDEELVVWFAVQAALVLTLGVAVALVRLRRGASAR